MGQEIVYRVTSIGRPLDPNYPTNKAVLFLMPLAGLIAGAAAGLRGADAPQVGLGALTGALVVFGAWALGRELAPDHHAVAFAGMTFAFIAFVVVGSPSLILLFATLFLVRIVNRSVGWPARLTDSITVFLLIVWVLYSTRNVLLGVVGALAFLLDAVLRDAKRQQFAFAVLCLAASGAWAFQHGPRFDPGALGNPLRWMVITVSVGFGLAILRTRRVSSAGDVTGVPLSLSRVRAGMLIGLLMALAPLAVGADGVEASSPVWAALSGVLLQGLARKPSGTQTVLG